MPKPSPWIKVYDSKGKCVRRCKDPNSVKIFFVSIGWHEYKLFIDDMEYNPPWVSIGYLSGSWNGSDIKVAQEKVKKKLEELIDLHVSFYYV